MDTATLTSLGLTTAAAQLQKREDACERWGLAYAHYRFVTEAQVNTFVLRCHEEWDRTRLGGHRKELIFTTLKDYPAVPPISVLTALQEARDRKIFDAFEIAHIEWRTPVPDPILFGRITGCPDRFFIAEWGEDVSYADLVK